MFNNDTSSSSASKNKKSDPSVQSFVGEEHLEGLDAATTDKVNLSSKSSLMHMNRGCLLAIQTDYALNNASGTSEERRGEDLKLPEKTGQGFTKEKTASEGLVEGFERRM